MIRLKFTKAEQIITNNNRFDPREIIKTSEGLMSELKALAIDNKALSAEYQNNDGRITQIEFIKDKSTIEAIEPKSQEEKSLIKSLKKTIKNEKNWTKCNEVILLFQ